MALVGTAISAGGSLMGGIQAQQSADANAAALEQQGVARREKGKYDAEAAQRDLTRNEGALTNRIAGTGVTQDSFSDVMADTIAEGKLAQAAIKWGADREIANLQFQADASRSKGQSALFSGLIGAASAGVAGYGKVTKMDLTSQKSSAGISLFGPFDE